MQCLLRHKTGLSQQKPMAEVHVVEGTPYAHCIVLEKRRTRTNICFLSVNKKLITGALFLYT